MKKASALLTFAVMLLVEATLVSVEPLPHAAYATVNITDMSLGSRGADVRMLQERLKFLGYYHGAIQGSYNWQTYWSVRNFQYAFGLPIDGIAGKHTLRKLALATVSWRPSSPATNANVAISAFASSGTIAGISQNDINLIAHVVYGEARGQPFIGQVAVAAVILNRYHSSKFPHSIPAIIYQPGAFTSISNGQAWLGLHAQNTEAVLDAVHGFDPTHGALYYWNPATATSPWIWTQPVMLRIGQHVFAK